MGLGEGVAFPTMQAIMKGWVPVDKRSRSLSLIYSGHQIGSILSLLMSPFIISTLDVSTLFYFYGALGFLWLSVWDPMVSPYPPSSTQAPAPVISNGSSSGGGSPESAAMLSSNSISAYGTISVMKGSSLMSSPSKGETPPAAKMAVSHLRDLPWRLFLSNKCFWALLMAHSTFGIGYNMLIAWLPTYYNQEFKVDLRGSSLLSILPWLMMALGTNASGWCADALINSKLLSTTKTRKLLQMVGNLGPGLCLMYLALAPQRGALFEAVLMLSLSMMTLGMQAGGFASTHTDISTRYASALFGITNAGASLAGSLFVYGVGLILDHTHAWSLIFQLVAICNFVSAIMYFSLATSELQFD